MMMMMMLLLFTGSDDPWNMLPSHQISGHPSARMDIFSLAGSCLAQQVHTIPEYLVPPPLSLSLQLVDRQIYTYICIYIYIQNSAHEGEQRHPFYSSAIFHPFHPSNNTPLPALLHFATLALNLLRLLRRRRLLFVVFVCFFNLFCSLFPPLLFSRVRCCLSFLVCSLPSLLLCPFLLHTSLLPYSLSSLLSYFLTVLTSLLPYSRLLAILKDPSPDN